MAQKLKEEVRRGIVDAAAAAFVDSGYQGATVANIARGAGIAVGNVYRYFSGKKEIYETVVSPEFAENFLALLHKRVKALRDFNNGTGLEDKVLSTQQQLLEFWIAHRLQVIIILDRSEGTAYANFSDEVSEILIELALAHAHELKTTPVTDSSLKFVLQIIFRNTTKTIVHILEHTDNEEEIRTLFALWGRYELDGLNGLLGK